VFDSEIHDRKLKGIEDSAYAATTPTEKSGLFFRFDRVAHGFAPLERMSVDLPAGDREGMRRVPSRGWNEELPFGMRVGALLLQRPGSPGGSGS
jgi:hypothetical protein